MKNQNKIKIAITGSSGVLGRYFINKYKKKFFFYKFKGDVTKKNDLNKWLQNIEPQIFLHFAAVVPLKIVENKIKYSRKVNVDSVSNIIEILKQKKNMEWFFFSSTSHVYKKSINKINESSKLAPTSKYGSQKLRAEYKILKNQKKCDFKICIGRIFSYTNHDQDKSFLIPSLTRKIAFHKKKYLKIINSRRDFIHIDDICNAIYFLLNKKYVGIYNIGSGKPYSISFIANFIKRKLNKNINIVIKKDNKYDCLSSDNNKLKREGWKPKKKINKILNDYLKLSYAKILE